MKKIVAGMLVTALALGAIAGASYGIAAAISTGGVDDMGGGGVTVTDLECGTGSGLISGDVTCTAKKK